MLTWFKINFLTASVTSEACILYSIGMSLISSLIILRLPSSSLPRTLNINDALKGWNIFQTFIVSVTRWNGQHFNLGFPNLTGFSISKMVFCIVWLILYGPYYRMGFVDYLTMNLKMGQCISEVFLNTVLHYLLQVAYFYGTERTFTFTSELSWPLGNHLLSVRRADRPCGFRLG